MTSLVTILLSPAEAAKALVNLLKRKPTLETANEIADVIGRASLCTDVLNTLTAEESEWKAKIDKKIADANAAKIAVKELETSARDFMLAVGQSELDKANANEVESKRKQTITFPLWTYNYKQTPEGFDPAEGMRVSVSHSYGEKLPKPDKHDRLLEWARTNCPEAIIVTESLNMSVLAKAKGTSIKALTAKQREQIGVVFTPAVPAGSKYIKYTAPSVPN